GVSLAILKMSVNSTNENISTRDFRYQFYRCVLGEATESSPLWRRREMPRAGTEPTLASFSIEPFE
ncbi:MAG TPA: hypothetical protein VMT64_09460, partial [Candidatus Binataceae bacterium]|nr:hypothetical protein [Candidatus Binataceae bacterium]